MAERGDEALLAQPIKSRSQGLVICYSLLVLERNKRATLPKP